MRYCRSLLLFVFLVSLLIFSVHAEDSHKRLSGFWDSASDFFDAEAESELPLEEYSINNNAPMLMSVSPEDIVNGALTFTYSSILDPTQTSAGYASVTSSDAMNSVRTGSLGVVLRDDQPTTYTDTISVRSNDVIVDKGEIFDFSLNGIVNYWDVSKITNSGQTVFDYFCEDLEAIDLSVYLVLRDLGSQKIDTSDIVFTVNSSGSHYYISMSVKDPLEHDLLGIDIVMKYDVQDAFGMPAEAARAQSTTYASYNPHHTVGFYNSEFVLSIIDQTNGLLGGIIDWLKGIWEGILSLPDLIYDNIISLFVPSGNFLDSFRVKIDNLFLSRFGALYESFDFILYFCESLYTFDREEYLTFPELSIPLPEGNEFVFGGWEVDVVPDAIEVILEPLRFFVNVIIMLAFGTSVFKKFEKLIQGSGD